MDEWLESAVQKPIQYIHTREQAKAIPYLKCIPYLSYLYSREDLGFPAQLYDENSEASFATVKKRSCLWIFPQIFRISSTRKNLSVMVEYKPHGWRVTLREKYRRTPCLFEMKAKTKMGTGRFIG